MTVQVIIPFAGDCPHRLTNLRWMVERYGADYPVTVAEGDSAAWSKGAAVDPVVQASDADVLVIADADCVVRKNDLRWAISEARRHGWASPHSRVYRLDEDTSARFRAAGRLPAEVVLDRKPTNAVPAGGVVVMRRDAYDLVGGFDPRFIGWGGEDSALSLMLGRLVYPFAHEGDERPMWHLWHPPAATWNRPNSATRELARAYRRAARAQQLPAMAEEVRRAYLR